MEKHLTDIDMVSSAVVIIAKRKVYSFTRFHYGVFCCSKISIGTVSLRSLSFLEKEDSLVLIESLFCVNIPP